MVSAKLLVSGVCLLAFAFLIENISSRPAGDSDDKNVHHHKTGGDTHVHHFKTGGSSGGGGDGGSVHHHETGGETHVHHFKVGGSGGDGGGDGDGGDADADGGTHVHHFKIDGSGGGGGAGGDTETDIDVSGDDDADDAPAAVPDSGSGGGAGGDVSVPDIFQNLDPALIAKLKTHAYGHFGVDSTKPKDCEDAYKFNDGVMKHFIRGARDAGDAFLSGVNGIIQGVLPEIGPLDALLNGTQGALEALICGVENAGSDFASDWDSATHYAKHGLVDAFKLQGDGLLAIPEGIAGIAGEAVDAAGSAVVDGVSAIGKGLGDLLGAL